jgi:hypothetical protein
LWKLIDLLVRKDFRQANLVHGFSVSCILESSTGASPVFSFLPLKLIVYSALFSVEIILTIDSNKFHPAEIDSKSVHAPKIYQFIFQMKELPSLFIEHSTQPDCHIPPHLS